MKKLILLLLLILNYNPSEAQINLVPNSSFEDTLNCDSFYFQNTAFPWFTPTNCTPDYYYGLSPTCQNSALQNPSGYQLPEDGIAYIGLFLAVGNTREYISVKLLDTLQAGQLCSLSFYISRANEFYLATDDFGAYLSDTNLLASGCSFLPFIPQFENSSGNFITDSLNWTHFTGSYIAMGGEQYLTIGNFKDSANTSLIDADNGNGANGSSYYYIDNVTLHVNDTTVGIQQYQHKHNSNFLVWPTLISKGNEFKINSNMQAIGDCNVFSLDGRLIQSIKIQNGINTIDTDLLKSGWYLLVLNIDNQIQVFKIVIT